MTSRLDTRTFEQRPYGARLWRVLRVLRSFGGQGQCPAPTSHGFATRVACASHQSLADVSAEGSGRRGARASVARLQDPSHGGPQVPRRGHTGAGRGCPGTLLPPPKRRRCRQSSRRHQPRVSSKRDMRDTGPRGLPPPVARKIGWWANAPPPAQHPQAPKLGFGPVSAPLDSSMRFATPLVRSWESHR